MNPTLMAALRKNSEVAETVNDFITKYVWNPVKSSIWNSLNWLTGKRLEKWVRLQIINRMNSVILENESLMDRMILSDLQGPKWEATIQRLDDLIEDQKKERDRQLLALSELNDESS